MQLLDSRRYTGANLLMDVAGPVVDVEATDDEIDGVISTWRANLAALLPGPRGWRAPLRGGSWGFVYLCLLGGGLIFAFCQGVVSSQPHKMVFAAVPLFAAGAVGLYRSALQWPGVTHMRERAALALTLVCVTLTFQSLALTRHHFAGEALLGRLDTPFSHPLLSPIRSSAAKVEAIEGALAHLEPHLETGDFLLAYDLVPGFYYLTGTRSAVNTSWLAKDLPLRVRKDALRYMVENGRVPEYCLRARRPFGGPPHAYSQNPSLDPIHAYVSRHYELEAVFEPFEIWKRKPRPQRMPRSREGVGKGVPE